MQSITLTSKGQRDLLIEKVYEESTHELWVNSEAHEIVNPMLYSTLNQIGYGNCIDINTIEYSVKNIEGIARHS